MIIESTAHVKSIKTTAQYNMTSCSLLCITRKHIPLWLRREEGNWRVKLTAVSRVRACEWSGLTEVEGEEERRGPDREEREGRGGGGDGGTPYLSFFSSI